MKHKQFLAAHLDFYGFTASFVCVLHCIALPVLISIAGISSLEYLEKAWIEWIFLFTSLVLALFSLFPAYLRRHKKFMPLGLVFLSFFLMAMGQLLASAGWEAFLSSAGAGLLAAAHYINWKMLRNHKSSS